MNRQIRQSTLMLFLLYLDLLLQCYNMSEEWGRIQIQTFTLKNVFRGHKCMWRSTCKKLSKCVFQVPWRIKCYECALDVECCLLQMEVAVWGAWQRHNSEWDETCCSRLQHVQATLTRHPVNHQQRWCITPTKRRDTLQMMEAALTPTKTLQAVQLFESCLKTLWRTVNEFSGCGIKQT